MRVLLVLEHYFPNKGGVERLFKNLAENLANNNFQVTVITTKTNKELLNNEVLNGVQLIRLPLYNRFLFTFLSIPYVIYYATKSDIIHTTSYNAALPAWIAAFLTRKKCLITFHEVWDNLWWKLPYYKLHEKLLFFLFEKIILSLPFNKYIAVSDATKNSLTRAGIDTSKIIRIYNGINYENMNKFIHEAPTIPTITYYGRLGASKGLNNLLIALSSINSRYKLILIIPKTPSFIYKKIIQLIDSSHLKDKTILKHDLADNDLFNTIAKSTFVVIPSLSEGFCFNAVECSAIQIPVVASKNTALLETVSGKFIYFEENQLLEAMLLALKNQWNESDIKYFNEQTTIDNYMDCYAQLIS